MSSILERLKADEDVSTQELIDWQPSEEDLQELLGSKPLTYYQLARILENTPFSYTMAACYILRGLAND